MPESTKPVAVQTATKVEAEAKPATPVAEAPAAPQVSEADLVIAEMKAAGLFTPQMEAMARRAPAKVREFLGLHVEVVKAERKDALLPALDGLVKAIGIMRQEAENGADLASFHDSYRAAVAAVDTALGLGKSSKPAVAGATRERKPRDPNAAPDPAHAYYSATQTKVWKLTGTEKTTEACKVVGAVNLWEAAGYLGLPMDDATFAAIPAISRNSYIAGLRRGAAELAAKTYKVKDNPNAAGLPAMYDQRKPAAPEVVPPAV